MSTVTVALVLAAGGLGAVLRALVIDRLPRAGLTVVNVAGTLLLAVTVALGGAGRLGPGTAAVLGLGLSGSLTTFSGWMERVDAEAAVDRRRAVVTQVLLPLVAGVGVTVAVFVLLS